MRYILDRNACLLPAYFGINEVHCELCIMQLPNSTKYSSWCCNIFSFLDDAVDRQKLGLKLKLSKSS